MAIVVSDRPQNPPYVNVRVEDLSVGDYIQPHGGLGRTEGAEPLRIIGLSDLYPDGRMPWMRRDIILEGFHHTWLGNITTVPVWRGPKRDAWNNPALVAWHGYPISQYVWRGNAPAQQEGAAA
jgi:hypothetical protein